MPSTATSRLNGLTTSVAVKAPVKVVTSSNITLSGLQTINGVVVEDGDRVLVRSQTDGTQNGIWVVDEADWHRAKDFDGPLDVVKGTLCCTSADSGDAVYFRVTSNNPIIPGTTNIQFVSVTAHYTPYIRDAAEIAHGVYPDDYSYSYENVRRFGALGNGTTDDTVKIQAAIDYVAACSATEHKYLVFPYGVYQVSQIEFRGGSAGVTYVFEGSQIRGKAIGSYSSVVSIRSAYCNFQNMVVNANFNASYQCAIHWATTDPDTTPVNFNRFDNCTATQARLGWAIGMLPSQAGVYYASGSSPAEPIAVDAPVSESVMVGCRTTYCVEGMRVAQPNGKVSLHGCHISGDDDQQTGLSASTSALNVLWGEVTMEGGTLEVIQEAAGLFCTFGTPDVSGGVTIPAATVSLNGVIMESKRPIYINGRADVRISQNCDWGVNGDQPFVWVDNGALGRLIVSDGFMLRANGSGSFTQPMVKAVADVNGTSSVNNVFICYFEKIEFRNHNFASSGGTYLPLVFGVRAGFRDCLLTTYNTSDVRTAMYRFSQDRNLLSGIIDLAADVITAYGNNATATSGGITFTNAGTASNWGADATIPSADGETFNKSIRLVAAGGANSITATSAKFPVEPGRAYIASGFIKTGASSANMKLTARFYDFGGANASTAQTDMFGGAESQFGATWQPFMVWCVPPADGCQMSLEVYAENGADVRIALPKVA